MQKTSEMTLKQFQEKCAAVFLELRENKETGRFRDFVKN